MYKFIAVIPSPYINRQKPKLNNTKMLKKNEVLELLGIAPTNPKKNEVFERLPTYNNPFSKQAIFKEEDVLDLIHNFPVNDLDN